MASSIFDDVRIMQSSAGPEVPQFTVQSKTWLDINDNNQGNYSGGQITFDFNQIVSNEDFLDWASSYVTIPVVITLTGGTTYPVESKATLFAAAFKGSNLSIINSLQLTCSNQTIISNQQMSNIPVSYKLLTSWSQADVDSIGSFFNFQKDSARTFTFSNYGGEINNNPSTFVPIGNPNQGSIQDSSNPQSLAVLAESNAGTGQGGGRNLGFFLRCQKQAILYNDDNLTGTGLGTSFTSPTSVVTTRRSICYTTPIQTAAGLNQVRFELQCQLPMRYVHDFFGKMPYNRGALWQFVLTTHLPSTFNGQFTNATVQTLGTRQFGAVNVITPAGFCPFMISGGCSVAGNQGIQTLDTANAVQNISVTAAIGFGTQNVCTMHLAMVKLSPQHTKSYMESPRKTIVFDDFLRAVPSALQNIVQGGSVTANITAGQARVRGLLLCPYLAAGTFATGGNGNVNARQSALTPCGGGTVLPMFFAENFQVSIGGRPLFAKNYTYRYDEWFRETYGINASNGNAIDGLAGGLIDYDDYNNGYGYIYVNLEHHLASSDDLPVSVDVSFTNGSNCIVSMDAFLFYEKSFTLDCITGKILV